MAKREQAAESSQRATFTLGQLMASVAVFAAIFATLAPSVAIAFSCFVLVVSLLGWIVARATLTPWLQVASWAFACYPLLLIGSLYATWATAWIVLGHQPRGSLDDPKRLGNAVLVPYVATSFFLLCFVVALVANFVLTTLATVGSLLGGRDSLRRTAAIIFPPAISWPLGFAWLKMDPGRVLIWYFD